MLFRYETLPALFDEVFSVTEPAQRSFPALFPRWGFVDRRAEYPYVNIAELKDEIQVVAEVPGIAKEDVSLKLHDGTLTISGERKDPEEKDSESLRREIAYGSFSRTIQLPEGVDAEKVTAEYTNGVLRIRLPKHEAMKPKEISIR